MKSEVKKLRESLWQNIRIKLISKLEQTDSVTVMATTQQSFDKIYFY